MWKCTNIRVENNVDLLKFNACAKFEIYLVDPESFCSIVIGYDVLIYQRRGFSSLNSESYEPNVVV